MVKSNFSFLLWRYSKLNYSTTEIPSGNIKTHQNIFEIIDELPCHMSVNVLVNSLADCLEGYHPNNVEWRRSDRYVQDENGDSACCRPQIVLFLRK